MGRFTYSLFALALSAIHEVALGGCYRLYDADDRVIYEADHPPFDISYPSTSGSAAASRSRGEKLFIDAGNSCDGPPSGGGTGYSGLQFSPRSGARSGSGRSSGDQPYYGYGHEIETGPRGGRYWRNEKGKRNYVDR